MFGSAYLGEHLFSLLKVNKSALRSRMMNICDRRSTMRIVSAQDLNADILLSSHLSVAGHQASVSRTLRARASQ